MKKLFYVLGLGMVALLAGCGSNNAKQQASSSQASSSSAITSSVTSSSVTSSSATSSSATNGSSVAQSSSATTGQNTSGLSDKQVGVMIGFLANPNWFKESLDGLYYQPGSNTNTKNTPPAVKNYSYVSEMGDPTSFIYYQVSGNNITYKLWIPGAKGVADGHWKTQNVTADQLKKDYYVNQSQKDEVNGDVSKLKSAQKFINAHKY